MNRALFSTVVDKTLWTLFLAIVFILPFLPPFIFESTWWLVISFVFLAISLHVLFCNDIIKRRCGKSLVRIFPILVLIAISVLWQWLQIVIYSEQQLIKNLEHDSLVHWFSIDKRISVSPVASWWQLSTSVYMLGLTLLATLLINRRSRIKQIVWLITGVVVLHAVIGILAQFQGLVLVDASSIDGHYDVARGVFVNRNHFASFMILGSLGLLTFLFARILRANEGVSLASFLDEVLSPRLLLYAGIIIVLFALLLSQSRAAFLGIIASSIVIIAVAAKHRARLNLGIFTAGFLVLIILSLIVAGEGLITRLNSESFSLGERLIQWEITLRAIGDRWFSGYGAGSYAMVFQLYRENAPLREVVFDQSHSYWLTIWLEQGLPGLLLQIAIVVLGLYQAIKNLSRRTGTFVNAISLACLFVMLCCIIQSLVDFNLQVVNLRSLFFLVVALVYIAPCLYDGRSTNGGKKRTKNKPTIS
jgi:O-antigen ligase